MDAVKDGDHIYAIMRGIGINNDGAEKAGFYAPSVKVPNRSDTACIGYNQDPS
nr:hypothetical protein P5621_09785 [Bacillus subtilis]